MVFILQEAQFLHELALRLVVGTLLFSWVGGMAPGGQLALGGLESGGLELGELGLVWMVFLAEYCLVGRELWYRDVW